MTTQGGKDCYSEVISFLENCSSLNEVSSLLASEKVQERTRELLDKNWQGNLTEDEEKEFDEYQELNHITILIKANSKMESLKE